MFNSIGNSDKISAQCLILDVNLDYGLNVVMDL